jgi:site-specific recombinase XerD
MQDWLTHELAESSIKMYRRDIAAYQDYASSAGLDPMQPHTLRAWRDWLLKQTQPRYSSNTINRMLSAVKRIIKEARQRDLIDELTAARFADVEGVRIDPVRLKPHARTRISPADMRQLTSAPGIATLIALRDTALLHVLASSGLRASELVSLKPEQIEEREGGEYLLWIVGKNETRPTAAYLSQEAHAAIEAWLTARPIASPYIFTAFANRGGAPQARPMTTQALWDAVQKYAARIGLAHIKPHDVRRFLGTILAKEDIRQAQKALRHKRIQTTADHYVLDELEPGKTNHLY